MAMPAKSASAVTPCFVTLPSLTQPFCAYSCADSVRPVVGLAVGRAYLASRSCVLDGSLAHSKNGATAVPQSRICAKLGSVF